MKLSANAERALHAGMSHHHFDDKFIPTAKSEFDLAGFLFLAYKRRQAKPQPLVVSLPVTMYRLVDILYPRKYKYKKGKLSVANERVWNRAYPIFNELMRWDSSLRTDITPALPPISALGLIKIVVLAPATPVILIWHFFKLLPKEYARAKNDKDSK